MEQTVVKAETGRPLGTRNSRRMRREGLLPGVVYGLGKDPVNVHVVYTDLRDALKTEAGLNTVFNLGIDGDEEMVLVKSIQRDIIKRTVTHVDFIRIAKGQKITIEVPIHLTGEAVLVLEAGGIVDQTLFELTCEAIPSKIPDAIEVDISELTLDHAIHLADITLPEGTESSAEPDTLIVTSSIPRVTLEAEEETVEGEEGEEGAEGEEGEDGAEASDGDGGGDADSGGD